MEKLGPPSQTNQKTDITRMTDTSLPDLVSTLDSGDGSEEEKKTGNHGQGCGRKGKETNLSGGSRKKQEEYHRVGPRRSRTMDQKRL